VVSSEKKWQGLAKLLSGSASLMTAEQSQLTPRTFADLLQLIEATPVWVNPAGSKYSHSQSMGDDGSSADGSNLNDLSHAKDWFASNPSTCREKMIVDALKLDVLGCNRKGGVKVFSLHHRRSVVIDRPAKLFYEDLLQIAGDPAKERIAKSKEEAEGSTDTFLLSEVKEAISLLAGYKTLSDECELGMGCWHGETITGEAYPSVVLVGKGEAAEWNGDKVLRKIEHPRCRGHILDFESAADSWYEHAKLADYMQQCKSLDFRKAVFSDALALFSKWRWSGDTNPLTVTGLAFSTWVQTLWDWRPQVSIVGKTNSGKSMLTDTFTKLYGKLAEPTTDATAAGIRQVIQHSAKIVMYDEFDISSHTDKAKIAENAKIMAMLRGSGRGTNAFRGTGGDQKGQKFSMRHIVWTFGIHGTSDKGADKNRAICMEINPRLPDAPMMVLPSANELTDLGQRMLAVAIYCVHEAKRIAGEIKDNRIPGVHDRVIESYAVPSSLVAVIQGGGVQRATELLLEMVAGISDDEKNIVSDEDELLNDIFTAHIQIGPTRFTVAQLLNTVIKQGRDWEAADDNLQANGIKVSTFGGTNIPEFVGGERIRGEACLSVSYKQVASRLLRGTRWEGQAINMILRRYPLTFHDQKRIGGSKVRCMSMLLEKLRVQYFDLSSAAMEEMEEPINGGF